MISIIHPSRGRADIALEVANKWIAMAGCDIEYILSIDNDDEQKSKYLSHMHHGIRSVTIIHKNRSAIDAVNRGAREAKGNILIVISDDFDCHEDWGKSINIIMGNRSDWILKTLDGIQDWVITLPIMDYTYYQRFGYIYYPAYLHGWCDTEMTCVAELTG